MKKQSDKWRKCPVGHNFSVISIFYYYIKLQSGRSRTFKQTKERKYVTIEILVNTELTHYHTMPHFDALKMYSCGKHCEKRRNCFQQAISPFLTMFSNLYGPKFSILNAL